MLRIAMRRSTAARRGVAASVRRDVDWGRLSSRMVTEEAKAEFGKFRAAVSQLENDVAAAPEADPTIDWAAWKARIKAPGVVDELKGRFETLSFPTMEFEPEVVAQAEKELAELTDTAKQMEDVANRRLQQLSKILAGAEAERANLPYVTADDILRKHPQWKDEIVDELKDDKWDWM